MNNNTLFMLTEEEMKLHEEFHQCQNEEELEEFMKKVEILNESRENNEIPHLNMTLEEYCTKFNSVPYEEIRRKMNI
ncbi:MAG: hypothetical protein MJZ19_00875 [Paludibacteraceae bacterium]|nr:hypothetical protein [Paludibacteraceae bacterium]